MNKPLLNWLLLRYPDTPKTRAKQWVLAGRISVGGVILRKPHQLIPDPGAALQLLERQAASLDPNAGWRIHPRVTLIHLDGSLGIVNKGPGLISVPAETPEISALSIVADFLAGRLKAQDRAVAGRTLPASFRRMHPLPVHRLDKYTSGAFCIAMNPRSRQQLLVDLRAHKIGASTSRSSRAIRPGRREPGATGWSWAAMNCTSVSLAHAPIGPESKALSKPLRTLTF